MFTRNDDFKALAAATQSCVRRSSALLHCFGYNALQGIQDKSFSLSTVHYCTATKGFPLDFNVVTVFARCGLQIAWLRFTLLPCHHFALLDEFPCFQRITSYLFAFLDNILGIFGITKSAFVVTSKVVDEDVSERYKQELMEFGTISPMFTILATIALLNAFTLVGAMKRLILEEQSWALDPFALQMILCGLLVFINLPVYKGLFLRKDKGTMPSSVTYRSIAYALAACLIALYY
ncbi:hypothetical protein FNV43_RR05395 [Rhamnella rubrinervis]|uniref:Uncharacterized protein n=1 Tax=Rhamnella rubrinervis TaxID=2594499 RepID=A0A8K0HLI3_9ROSA|nr:hypothetical protein FNV43_RR05395 [Rhamnella rubrinervis]